MSATAAAAAIDIEDVRKDFGGVAVLKGIDLAIAPRRIRGARRPIRLRQVHAAEAHCRARDHVLRRDPHERHGGERPAATRPRHRHGVPVLRALPAHERQGQHGLQPAPAPHPARGHGRGDPQGRRQARAGSAAGAQAAPALRRPAPARRHGPRHRAQPARLPLRRAPLQPRRPPARADALRDPQAAPRPRRHLRLRHARPDRGHDHGRPHRRHEWRCRAAGRGTAGPLRRSRQRFRGRLHRLAGHELPQRQHRAGRAASRVGAGSRAGSVRPTPRAPGGTKPPPGR